MTNKQRILQMVERWPEDISFDEAIYRVYALKKIEAGIKDLDAGLARDHDDVFDALERRCDGEIRGDFDTFRPTHLHQSASRGTVHSADKGVRRPSFRKVSGRFVGGWRADRTHDF